MCTRFYLDDSIPELKNILEAGTRGSLARRFLTTHGRPILTNGEVRPTDIVPVIAPNARGQRSVFPMQWGFLARDQRRTLFNARMKPQRRNQRSATHGHPIDASSRLRFTTSGNILKIQVAEP